ncbi:MAG: P-II family nitrogen regulator [Candidatus Rokubacteria bacterium]|nr:P-II family nitrogen regulator [Candidatus Rokubacteria bacterium]
MEYHCITCIVERGKAEGIADEALRAGAHGVTIYQARGKGVRERLKFVGRFIDPEKEVILIVTRKHETQTIFDTVVKAARLHEPGKGLAYVQAVEQVVGFLEPATPAGAADSPALS